MKVRRIVAAASIAAATLAGPLAGFAQATPDGKGLVTVDWLGVTTLSCTNGVNDPSTIVSTRGDSSSTWFADGSHIVTMSVNFTGSSSTFVKRFGTKSGIADATVTCTFAGFNQWEGDFSGTITGALVPPSA